MRVHDTVWKDIKDVVGVIKMSKKLVLACEKCGSRNYSTVNNNGTERLEIKKFCQNCNAHTVHKETK